MPKSYKFNAVICIARTEEEQTTLRLKIAEAVRDSAYADIIFIDATSNIMVADQIVLMVGYDHTGIPETYRGELKKDRYGKKIPKAAHGSVNLGKQTSSTKRIMEKAVYAKKQGSHVIRTGRIRRNLIWH